MNGGLPGMRAGLKLILVLAVLSALCLGAASQKETADDWVKKGNDLITANSSEEALEAYDKALQLDPQNVSILLAKANAYDLLKLQVTTKALSIVEKMLEKNPQDALAWQAKGAALGIMGLRSEANQSFEKAIEIYDREIDRNPGNGTAWFFKAENLANLHRTEDALYAYDKAIELNCSTRMAIAWASKGGHLFVLGRLNDSLAAFDKSIDLNPNDPIVWFARSVTLKEMGRTREAEATYAKAEELGWG
jgi:tetratricopeptide (TPR) repeat protein